MNEFILSRKIEQSGLAGHNHHVQRITTCVVLKIVRLLSRSFPTIMMIPELDRLFVLSLSLSVRLSSVWLFVVCCLLFCLETHGALLISFCSGRSVIVIIIYCFC
jgi:hypothetical protein